MVLLIPSPIPVKKSLTPSTKPVKNPTAFFITFITLPIAFIIPGSLVTNHPIKIIPKKSNILPKNPLVLFAATVPSLFVTPVILDASNSSSLCFLRTFSLLFLKYSLSFDIVFLSKRFLSFVVLIMSLAIILDLSKLLVNCKAERRIELILIEDLKSEFFLCCSDIIIC